MSSHLRRESYMLLFIVYLEVVKNKRGNETSQVHNYISTTATLKQSDV